MIAEPHRHGLVTIVTIVAMRTIATLWPTLAMSATLAARFAGLASFMMPGLMMSLLPRLRARLATGTLGALWARRALCLHVGFGVLRFTLGAGRTRSTLAAAAATTTAGSPSTSAATTATAFGRIERNGFHARHFDPRDLDANQLLDRLNQAAFRRRGQGEGMAGTAGTARTADAMDVILGRERHVEIEDVAHVGDVEAAGRDV